MDAFDADVLIYAAVPCHELGSRVAALFPKLSGERAGVGSALLLPELLGKPLRDGNSAAVRVLVTLLSRLDLRPVDQATSLLSTVLAARYRLRAVDAVHLATAIAMGAHRFITNNSRVFPQTITEIDITYPADLPAAA
jgi:predicted nucleic acid-binding protein